ncbi:MAG: glycerophosphodiester phosphodiesterase family protein, partial [Steroidobacteraceae bacterium]
SGKLARQSAYGLRRCDEVRALEREREAAARDLGRPPPPRIGLYPETKHPSYFAAAGLALEPALLRALTRAGYAGREAPVRIQSFEVGNLQALRRLTDLPLVQLIEKRGAPYDCTARADACTYASMIRPEGLAAIARYADAIGVEKSLVLPVTPRGTLGEATPLVADAHAAGLEVHAWTFRAENEFLPLALRSGGDPAALGDALAEIGAFLQAGIDGLFIDQPALGVRARNAFSVGSRGAA